MTPQNDRDARVNALYRAHAARLFAYARRHAPPDLAEDLVADAFVIALGRYESVPVDSGEAYAWLVGTVRKLAANQYRRRASFEKYWRRAVRDYWATSTDSIEEAAAERDACLVALGRLSETDRQLLLLIAWDGLTNAQAADVLGISPRTLAVRLHRARQRLNLHLTSQSAHAVAMTLE